ncbi:uncharacterized protein LOC132281506 [Cornus florida]|uniref:uncharacterized protein LOC132281506 n=1 Tax=Cornus florida TaxID=4283 RepID=UPI00289E42F0|nr:uncharacterized protein LOC132281506 [Cornus florida]
MSEKQIQDFIHGHPLMFLENIDNELEAYCFECRIQIPTPENCVLNIDRLGAELPREIKHPLHPLHGPLTLRFLNSMFDPKVCHACGYNQKGFFFCCSVCDFQLDFNCIPLTPTKDHEEGVEQQTIKHLGKTHPLILCHRDGKNFYRSCSACNLPFKDDSIYVCLECKTLLHKSCFELAEEIKHHSFHPHHPLTLLPRPAGGTYWCGACSGSLYGCTYRCLCEDRRKCDFSMHAKCASFMPTIWSELHKHFLASFKSIRHDKFRCNVCGDNSTEFLRCVECNYNLHVRCNPTLPKTIKIEYHLHTLALTNFPVKDRPDEDDDVELICDACEEIRDLHHPTYYCAECHFVAHVDCHSVLPEVLRVQEEEWLGNIDNKIAELHKKIETETKELEPLMSKLNALLEKNSGSKDSSNEDSGNEDMGNEDSGN